jgi:hypothetical protein
MTTTREFNKNFIWGGICISSAFQFHSDFISLSLSFPSPNLRSLFCNYFLSELRFSFFYIYLESVCHFHARVEARNWYAFLFVLSTFSFSMVKEGFIGISPFSFLSIFVLLFIPEDFRTVGSRL